jgi:4-hydroxybenzoate polyprenyltransferase
MEGTVAVGNLGRAQALIRATHPGPSLVITLVIVLLAARSVPRGENLTLLAIAALLGEFSIGLSNDAFDADRDTEAGRTSKPIVAGVVSRRTVTAAAVVALAASVVLCFAISTATGLINVAMMAAGWAYNAGLKATLASGLMYVVGFGLIPAFAASTVPGQPWPSPWVVLAAAMLGLGGHFTNVLPDLAGDRVSGVRGLPQRIAAIRPGGPLAVRLTALVLLFGASVVIVLAAGRADALAIGGLVVAGALAVLGALGSGRVPFYAAMGIAIVDVLLFVR